MQLLVLFALVFVFTLSTALPVVPHRFLLRPADLSKPAAPRTCAPLCWVQYDRAIDLREYYRLDSCYQFNVSRESQRNPFFTGWDLQPLEAKGDYLYRNSWTDFSLGDDTFAFQSFRNRWTWNPDYSEIVHTSFYQSAAQAEAKMEVFDTVVFTSTVYRLLNATFVMMETTQVTQEIPYTGQVRQDVSRTTNVFPRLLGPVDCNNNM